MPRVSDIYASNYLKATDLQPLGQRRTALVHGVAAEPIGPEQKQALVLDLVTTSGKAWPKRAILNKTNAFLMAAAFGEDTDNWAGHQISIWAENVIFKGQVLPGIKLQPMPSTAPVAQPPAGDGAAAAPPQVGNVGELDDEIPF
jgi:hypothetical protein